MVTAAGFTVGPRSLRVYVPFGTRTEPSLHVGALGAAEALADAVTAVTGGAADALNDVALAAAPSPGEGALQPRNASAASDNERRAPDLHCFMSMQ